MWRLRSNLLDGHKASFGHGHNTDHVKCVYGETSSPLFEATLATDTTVEAADTRAADGLHNCCPRL